MKRFREMLKYLDGTKLVFLLALGFVVVETIIYLMTPVLFKYAVDVVINNNDPGNMAYFHSIVGRSMFNVVAVILGLAIFRGFFVYGKGKMTAIASERVAKNLRDMLYRHIQYLDYQYHSSRETGDLVQRCTSDIETVRRFLSIQLIEVGRIILMVVTLIIIMMTMSVPYTLISILLVPVLFFASYIFFKKIQSQFKDSDEAEGSLTTVLQENLSGVRVVRAFGREKFEIEKFEKVNKDHRNITVKLIKTLAIFWSSTDLVTLFQTGLVLVVGAYWTMTGEITLGMLIAFTTYETMLLWPIKQLGRILSDFGKATVSIDRIEEILNIEPEKELPNEIKPDIYGRIEFEHVNFKYEDGKHVLKDINLTIEQGQTIGILGSTGSGKSSLVHLLSRLHEYDGSIKIDGYELNTIAKQHIRSSIGLVLQEPYLYAKTISENIGISSKDFSDQEITHAASIASIDESIKKFADQYDTMIGEKGVSLSGGQKQRIAIARTIIANKPILVFDDSLSAVDTDTDLRIRRALKDQSKDTTTIIISHRLSTLAETDKIVVLEHGEITAVGTHQELIKKEGLYQTIWDIQRMVV